MKCIYNLRRQFSLIELSDTLCQFLNDSKCVISFSSSECRISVFTAASEISCSSSIISAATFSIFAKNLSFYRLITKFITYGNYICKS